MSRPGVSKELVIQAIDNLVRKGETPTVMKVREHLGTGSSSTIQRYVKEWKIQAFKDRVAEEQDSYEPIIDSTNQNNLDHAEQLKATEIKLDELSHQNQILSAELITVEQENVTLGSDNEKLNSNLEEITAQYKALLLEHQHLTSQYQALKEERKNAIATLLADKNAQIERLEQELKITNNKYLQAVKEVGRRGDDQLIAEKVKTVNLIDKVKELRENNTRLKEELSRAVKAKDPLVRALKQQQDLVSRFVTWEQLNEYAKEQQNNDL